MRIETFILAVALVSTPACAGGHTVRTLTRDLPAGGASAIQLSFPVGDVVVTAADVPQVGVEVRVECSQGSGSCAEAAGRVELAISGSGTDRLRIGLSGWPRMGSHGLRVNARIRVPKGTAVAADLGVGDLTISGVEANLQAKLGVGDVTVTMPEVRVGSVHLGTGVGDATLRTSRGAEEGDGFIGHRVHWQAGVGKAAVKVECGVGDAKVVLQ